MDKLDKIIETLTLLKAKALNALPKIPELPTHKTVSAPSMTPPPPKKLPGVNPSSDKDPNKVAQQLKAGQPQKPKIKQQLLKFNERGQWSLD